MKLKPAYIYLIGIGIVLIIVCGTCITQRNGIFSAKQAVEEARGNIEADYQRRFDLIPNLVATVKGFAKHEKETLEGVTAMRTGNELVAMSDSIQNEFGQMTLEQKQAAQAQLYDNYRIYVNAVHEAYPTLTSGENFKDLQSQIEGTENRIDVSRKRYNETVKAYNNKIGRFPGSLFSWGYDLEEMFRADPGASKAVKVDFDD